MATEYRENREKIVKTKKKRSTSSIVSTIFGIIIIVITVPMLLLNLTLIVKGIANKDEPPNMFGYIPLVVESGSMEPAILEGDMIFIDRVRDPAILVDLLKGESRDNAKDGDVICFKDGDSYVTHRIVSIEYEFTTDSNGQEIKRIKEIITKGDNNEEFDDPNLSEAGTDLRPVKPEDVIGVYRGGRVAKLGSFAIYLQTPLGVITFVAIPVVAFIIYDILMRLQMRREEEMRNQLIENEINRLKLVSANETNPYLVNSQYDFSNGTYLFPENTTDDSPKIPRNSFLWNAIKESSDGEISNIPGSIHLEDKYNRSNALQRNKNESRKSALEAEIKGRKNINNEK